MGGPMEGIKVVEMGVWVAGPSAAAILCDWGADVVKIEPPTGDPFRGLFAGALGVAVPVNPPFEIDNRGKRSICLDLTNEDACGIARRLVNEADVFVSNMRPRVLEQYALSYEAVRETNPRIVYCSLSGFGQTGPLAESPGHDINYGALAGVADQIGNAAGPALSNVPVADLLGGTMPAVMGILAALFDAQRTGQGRHVDVAIADGVLAHAVLPLAMWHQHGAVPAIGHGALTGGLACYGAYRTAWDLARHYRVSRGFLKPHATVKALNGVSFTLSAGQTLAVVGESGCGKSTLARALTLIEKPTSGSLKLAGTDAATATPAQTRALRRQVQMVFQNPYASLNPRKRVAQMLDEPLLLNTELTAAERRERIGRAHPAAVHDFAAVYSNLAAGVSRRQEEPRDEALGRLHRRGPA